MSNSSIPTVTIAGGGMAGLTAAYTLAKRGYKVTLYEATDRVGGALSAVHGGKELFGHEDVNFECSPHMFGEWYDNFFQLMDEIGVRKFESFQYCSTISFLQRGQPLKYAQLRNNGSIRNGFQNLFSGVDTPANLFLYWYSIIDILTQNFKDFSEDGSIGGTMSLNGFIVTRPYAPERVAQFLGAAMVNIWAVNSSQTSIHAFQDAAKFQAKSPTPTAWITTDSNSYDRIVKPLQKHLLDLGVCIEVNTRVLGVTIDGHPARVSRIAVESEGEEPRTIEVDNLVMAVPRFAMARLVTISAEGAISQRERPIWSRKDLASPWVEAVLSETRPTNLPPPLGLKREEEEIADDPAAKNMYLAVQTNGRTIAEHLPRLADASAAQGVPLAMLYVPFNKELCDIPDGYVGLSNSMGSLTFIKVPYLACRLGVKTVLAIGISNFGGIPAAAADEGYGDTSTMGDARTAQIILEILKEFGQFVSFDPADVVWSKVVLKSNIHHKLFLNTVGSERHAPYINDQKVENLFFAVGTTENPIQIATVEAAVFGGLQAAQALWAQTPSSDNNRKNPVAPIMPKTYTQAELWAMKVALAPWAVAAKLWSDAEAEYAAYRGGPPDVRGAANALAQAAMGWAGAPFWFGLKAARLVAATLTASRRLDHRP